MSVFESVQAEREAGASTRWGGEHSFLSGRQLQRSGGPEVADAEHGRYLRRRVTGTAGVLLRAKAEGHLAAVAPLLDQLDVLGFRLTGAVRERILRLAGEAS